MMGREINDAELAELDAGTSCLDPSEQIEGLSLRLARVEGEREEALGKLDAILLIESAHLRALEDSQLLIEKMSSVLSELNVGQHAGDCPAHSNEHKLHECDCSHPELDPMTLRVKSLLVAAENLNR